MNNNSNNKNIGQGDYINKDLASWSFDSNVPKNFDKHVAKSVPGYLDGHNLISLYSDFFINLPSKRIYDIGSSTGSLIEKIQSRHSKKDIEYIGIEPSLEMVKISQERKYEHPSQVEFIQDYISNVSLKAASFITSYYTIQFISPGIRQKIFDQIYNSLDWGRFCFFEKVRAPDARFQDYSTQTYNI